MNIKRFENGVFTDMEIPDWENGERQENYLDRIGYNSRSSDILGNDGFDPVIEIYDSKEGQGHLVEVCLGTGGGNYFFAFVPTSFDLIALCNQFAPLAQASLLQIIVDIFNGEDERPGLAEAVRKLAR